MLYYLMSVPICASCTSCHQLWQFSWDIGTDHGKLIASLVVGRSFFFRLNFPVSWFRRASWVSKPIFIGYSRCTMHSRFRCVWLYVLYELAAKSPPRDTILYFYLFCRFFFVHNFCSFYRYLLSIFIAWSHWIPCKYFFILFIWASSHFICSARALAIAVVSFLCDILKFNWLLFMHWHWIACSAAL